MEWRQHIAVDPEVHGGCPVISGTRAPVRVILGSLAGGMTVDEVCDEYRVTEEQVRAALAYAADTLSREQVTAGT